MELPNNNNFYVITLRQVNSEKCGLLEPINMQNGVNTVLWLALAGNIEFG